MTLTLSLVLYVLALIFLAFAALGYNPVPRIQSGWLGMLFWLVASLV